MRNLRVALPFVIITTGVAVGLGAITTASSPAEIADVTSIELTNWVEGIFKPTRRPPTRDKQKVCFISPNPNNGLYQTSWSETPLFAWQGDISSLTVREDGEVIWKENIESGRQYISYGERVSGSEPPYSLVPGGSYTLSYTIGEGESSVESEPMVFNILNRADEPVLAQAIQAELDEIDNHIYGSSPDDQQWEARDRAIAFQSNDIYLMMDVVRQIMPISELGLEQFHYDLQVELDAICESKPVEDSI